MTGYKKTITLQLVILFSFLTFGLTQFAYGQKVIIRTRHHGRAQRHHKANHSRRVHHKTYRRHHFASTNGSHRMSAKPSHISIEDAIKTEHLDPHVYHLAMHAYNKAKARHEVTRPYIALIDYSRPSSQKRFWILDLKHHTVPYYTYVAHGKNSGGNRTHYFSNMHGSHETSLGVFVTANTYTGHKGTSLRLRGLESGINDHALHRAVVIHGANYVSEHFIQSHGRLGRSWGCPALSMSLAKPVIRLLRSGSMVFSYYPNHNWLSHSRYLLS